MTVGRSGGIAGGAMALAQANETARISELQAENRRHIQNLPAKDRRGAATIAGNIDAHLPVLDVSARRPRIAPHQGTVLAFLAQQIAQEVVPEVAGLDRHTSAAEAYIGARDFNAEMLPQGAGFNISI
jgi:hypothetical protein